MILLIDNYDSFTFNLYQQVSRLGGDVCVIRNDELDLEGIRQLQPQKIILSPGPRTPADSGICIPVINAFFQTIPILGICLGHQCLAVAGGAKVISAQRLLFGKTSEVTQASSRLMANMPASFDVARYHSLVVDKAPQGYRATSFDPEGDIMSIEHEVFPLFGLQFHPESFLMLPLGDKIIQNFLDC